MDVQVTRKQDFNIDETQKAEEIFTIEKNSEQSTQKISPKFSVEDKGWIPDKAKQRYHDQRLTQSKWTFRLSLWGCLIGFGVIIWGLCISINSRNVEWIAIIAGTVIDVVAALFFYLNNKTNDKISEFFKELTVDSDKKDAQNLIQKIENSDIRDEVIVKLAIHLSGIDDEKICKYTKDICKK